MQLVLDTNGLTLRKRNKSFWVTAKQGKRMISPHRVTSIAVTADCLISSAAIRLAVQHEIPIFFLDGTARMRARLTGPGYGSIATIRRKQVLWAETPDATAWVISLFEIKLAEQHRAFAYLKQRRPRLRQQITQAMDKMRRQAQGFEPLATQPLAGVRQQIMGVEGQIARIYWPVIGAGLPTGWQFSIRSRRPAQDIFNAALNYLYGMLYATVEQAIAAAGLDPYLGFLHADQYNKPVFAYDVIEPFRPWADRLLLQLCLDKHLKPSHFDQKEGGFWLNKAGKRVLIPAFNDELEAMLLFDHKRLKRKTHIYRFTGKFAQFLLTT